MYTGQGHRETISQMMRNKRLIKALRIEMKKRLPYGVLHKHEVLIDYKGRFKKEKLPSRALKTQRQRKTFYGIVY